MPLTPEQLAHYREHGYAVGGRLLADTSLRELRGHMDAAIDRLPPGKRPENMPSIHYGNPYFLDLFLSPAFVKIAEQILGPDIALFTVYAISKRPNDGLPVDWHQDAAFFPIEPMETFTLWLAVDDADRDNGCMQVIPGSQRQRVALEHKVDTSQSTTLAYTLGSLEAGRTDFIEVPAGHYSVHDPYIVHGSAPNRSARRRCAITIKYVSTAIRLDRGFRSATGFDWANVKLYHAQGARGSLPYAN